MVAVSVIMAVHNGERFLEETMRSVLAQEFTDFEFLIVDDCSSDATPQILQSHGQADARIRLLRNDSNLGLARSLNRLLDEADAPIVARIDADDSCEPVRLGAQLAFLHKNLDHVLVGSSYRSIDALGQSLYEKRNPLDAWQFRWTSRFRMPTVHPSLMFRKTLPDGSLVRYDETVAVAQDYDLVSRLANLGKAANLGDVLVSYRKHHENITSTKSRLQHQAARKISQAWLERHYPEHIAAGCGTMLKVHHRLAAPTIEALATSANAMREVVQFDDDGSPLRRRWLRGRSAAMLFEAFFADRDIATRARMTAALLGAAPDLLPAMTLRYAEMRGWIATTAEFRPS